MSIFLALVLCVGNPADTAPGGPLDLPSPEKELLQDLKRRVKESIAQSKGLLRQSVQDNERRAELCDNKLNWPEGAEMFRKRAAETRQHIRQLDLWLREIDELVPSDFIAPPPRGHPLGPAMPSELPTRVDQRSGVGSNQ